MQTKHFPPFVLCMFLLLLQIRIQFIHGFDEEFNHYHFMGLDIQLHIYLKDMDNSTWWDNRGSGRGFRRGQIYSP
jgi:hypothetical protein